MTTLRQDLARHVEAKDKKGIEDIENVFETVRRSVASTVKASPYDITNNARRIMNITTMDVNIALVKQYKSKI